MHAAYRSIACRRQIIRHFISPHQSKPHNGLQLRLRPCGRSRPSGQPLGRTGWADKSLNPPSAPHRPPPPGAQTAPV